MKEIARHGFPVGGNASLYVLVISRVCTTQRTKKLVAVLLDDEADKLLLRWEKTGMETGA